MRIVGGSLKGRTLQGPRSDAIRPTSDRLRETIFNVLAHGLARHGIDDPVPGARVLDLFAGTGALAIEALSRGAAYAVMVDEGAEARGLQRGMSRPSASAERRASSGATRLSWAPLSRSIPSRSSSAILPTAEAWGSGRSPRRWPAAGSRLAPSWCWRSGRDSMSCCRSRSRSRTGVRRATARRSSGSWADANVIGRQARSAT